MSQTLFPRVLPFLAGAFAISLSATALSAQSMATQLDVTLLDFKVLSDIRVDDLKLSEASGASYDHDENLLRLVSDRGRIFAFDLNFNGNRFAAINPVSAFKLRNTAGMRCEVDTFRCGSKPPR